MPKLIGIGGVFLFAHNTERLAAWYQRHLGFTFGQIAHDDQSTTYYQELYYRDLLRPEQKLHTVFAIMPAKHELSLPRNQAMINYRVDDLDGLVQQLSDAGIACEPIHIGLDAEGQGKFTHLSDLEGNRIELWEHLSRAEDEGAAHMMRAAVAEARAFESWQDYQAALKRAIAPLAEEQLQRRVVPGLRAPGEIAEHIVFGRALHLHRTLGERAAELAPLLRWDDADDPPHTAAEIVQGLDLTWRFITDCLMGGSPTDPIDPERDAPIVQTIWGLLDHDLPHAGELSLLLGAGGLPGVEI